LLVHHDINGEGRTGGKTMKDLQSVVGRTVVTDE
jgi:hypothetical protein